MAQQRAGANRRAPPVRGTRALVHRGLGPPRRSTAGPWEPTARIGPSRSGSHGAAQPGHRHGSGWPDRATARGSAATGDGAGSSGSCGQWQHTLGSGGAARHGEAATGCLAQPAATWARSARQRTGRTATSGGGASRAGPGGGQRKGGRGRGRGVLTERPNGGRRRPVASKVTAGASG
uniref:Uncharacterized protein n=1 Tax=Oryza sativa subsp. japonica TaxID=39947 RepID=Q6YVB3_ORYSJ|nr:hypothetical protein [Oryza sativa Japonica Group]